MLSVKLLQNTGQHFPKVDSVTQSSLGVDEPVAVDPAEADVRAGLHVGGLVEAHFCVSLSTLDLLLKHPQTFILEVDPSG